MEEEKEMTNQNNKKTRYTKHSQVTELADKIATIMENEGVSLTDLLQGLKTERMIDAQKLQAQNEVINDLKNQIIILQKHNKKLRELISELKIEKINLEKKIEEMSSRIEIQEKAFKDRERIDYEKKKKVMDALTTAYYNL